MSKGGVTLKIMLGKKKPVPAPTALVAAIRKVIINRSDSNRTGFQIVLAGEEYFSSIKAMNRIILTVNMPTGSYKLFDGIITGVEFLPADEPGLANLSVLGKDLMCMLDRRERIVSYKGQRDDSIVSKIVEQLAEYDVDLELVKPPTMRRNRKIVPMQHDTDLSYIQKLSQLYNYVFFIETDHISGRNKAYWGPEKRFGSRQRPLSVGMGFGTNVSSLKFNYDSTMATRLIGEVFDPESGKGRKLVVENSSSPRLSKSQVDASNVRTVLIDSRGGLGVQDVKTQMQSRVNRALDKSLSVTGELDVMKYGDILKPRRLVVLRGASKNFDGKYYVKEVKDILAPGMYKQQFTLLRDGLGSTIQRINV